MTPTAEDGGEAGFSLVEVLIAFAIVALGLATFYTSMSLHLSGAAEARLRQETLLLAQSEIEVATRLRPLRIGETTGTFANGTKWQLRIEPVERTDEETKGAVPLLFRLGVFDERGRTIVSLTTLDIVRPDP